MFSPLYIIPINTKSTITCFKSAVLFIFKTGQRPLSQHTRFSLALKFYDFKGPRTYKVNSLELLHYKYVYIRTQK
jgi:hypothetical protein